VRPHTGAALLLATKNTFDIVRRWAGRCWFVHRRRCTTLPPGWLLSDYLKFIDNNCQSIYLLSSGATTRYYGPDDTMDMAMSINWPGVSKRGFSMPLALAMACQSAPLPWLSARLCKLAPAGAGVSG
jgi:hypothetical protein